jgi:hypothetical protein
MCESRQGEQNHNRENISQAKPQSDTHCTSSVCERQDVKFW